MTNGIIMPEELSKDLEKAKGKLAMIDALKTDGDELVRELITGKFIGYTFTKEGSTTRMRFAIRVENGKMAYDRERKCIYNPCYPVNDLIYKEDAENKNVYYIGRSIMDPFTVSLCIFK